jgi:hypothetical protein
MSDSDLAQLAADIKEAIGERIEQESGDPGPDLSFDIKAECDCWDDRDCDRRQMLISTSTSTSRPSRTVSQTWGGTDDA